MNNLLTTFDWLNTIKKSWQSGSSLVSRRRCATGSAQKLNLCAVWPDCAIYCTLGNYYKPVATIILPKLAHFMQSVKCVKIFHFSSEISFGSLFIAFWRLFTGHAACVECWQANVMHYNFGQFIVYLRSFQAIFAQFKL